MSAGRARAVLGDFGRAVGLVLVLATAWTAVEPRPGSQVDLDERMAALVDEYAGRHGQVLDRPAVVVADLNGPAVATSSCRDWRISVRPGAAATLSDRALDELLAHELAHLIVCAETGRSAGHGADWWQRYHALVGLT